jgi:hypothetical protein
VDDVDIVKVIGVAFGIGWWTAKGMARVNERDGYHLDGKCVI